MIVAIADFFLLMRPISGQFLWRHFLLGARPAPGGQDNISDGNFPVRNPKKSLFHSPCFPPFAFLPPRKRSHCWLLIYSTWDFWKLNKVSLFQPFRFYVENSFLNEGRKISTVDLKYGNSASEQAIPPRFNPGTFLAPGSRSSNIQIFSPFQQWANIGKLQNGPNTHPKKIQIFWTKYRYSSFSTHCSFCILFAQTFNNYERRKKLLQQKIFCWNILNKIVSFTTL